MIYRQRTEQKTVVLNNPAFANTYTLRIPQARRRLEGIILRLWVNSGTSPVYGSDHIFPLVKEMRLKVNDKLGARTQTQVTGTGLIGFNVKQGLMLDRWSCLARAYGNSSTSAMQVTYPLWIRHPAIAEPVGNHLGIPLNQVNDDVLFEFDLETAANLVSSGGVPTISTLYAQVTIITREVADEVAYLPTELVTNTWNVLGTGPQAWDIPQGGFLSQAMIDTFSAYPLTRRDTASGAALGNYQVKYGTNIVKEIYPPTQIALNDMFTGAGFTVYSSALWAPQYFDHSHMIDFLFDDTFEGALSPGSMLNINTIQQGGDKAQIIMTAAGYANDIAKVTTHKFLTRNPEDLRVLVGG